MRDIDSDPPSWLVEIAIKIRDIIDKYQARAMFQRMIQEWRAENEQGPTDLIGPLPKRKLTLVEQYVLLAAIHDQCCEDESELNPWSDPAADKAALAAIKRRGGLTYSQQQAQSAGMLLYLLRYGVHTRMPPSDVPNVELIISSVEEDLKRWRADGGEQPESATEVTLRSVDDSRWMRIVNAEQITGINRGTISRAADKGDIANNGKKGDERRLDRQSFSIWAEKRANTADPQESEAAIERKLRQDDTD